MKVDLFHGEDDKFAPYSYALYLDEKLPNSELHGYPGEGHLFVMDSLDQVFRQVAG